jgi:hypothetical protein
MSPKEIILKLINRIGLSRSILFSNKDRFYSMVPGEVIASLPEEERIALQNLTAKDISDVSAEAPIEFFCDKYYKDKDEREFARKLQEEFDNRHFRK